MRPPLGLPLKSRLFLTATRNSPLSGLEPPPVPGIDPPARLGGPAVGIADAGIRKIICDSTGDGQGWFSGRACRPVALGMVGERLREVLALMCFLV